MTPEMLNLSMETLRACAFVAKVFAATNWAVLLSVVFLLLRVRFTRKWTITLSLFCLVFAGLQILSGLALACARFQFLFIALVPEYMSYGANPGFTYFGFVNDYWWSISPFVLSGINLVVSFGLFVFSRIKFREG